ncbi:MAG: tetratricopeptide repeat protein [Nitrospiria bacterium]
MEIIVTLRIIQPFFLSFALILVISFSSFAQSSNPSPVIAPSEKDHLQKGTENLTSGNLDEAEREFKKALLENPNNHRAHFGLGLVFLQKKAPDQSQKSFNAAISIQPDYAPAYQGLGQVFELKKDFAKAVLNYQKTISLEKVNPAFATYVAFAKFRITQIGKTPEEALQIQGDLSKGNGLLKEKKRSEALQVYESILSIAPDQLEALENVGTINFELGKFEEAKKALEKVVTINPGILFAYILLGGVNEAMGRIGDAWDQYHTVTILGEKSPQLPEVRRATEKIKLLGSTKDIALEVDARLKKVGSSFEKDKNADAAEAEYRSILKLVPENIRAKYGLGVVLFGKENFKEAEKLFLDATSGDPFLIKGHLFLGEIYLKEKEVQGAFNEFSKVKELILQLGAQKESKEELEEAEREISQFGNDSSTAVRVARLLDEGEGFLKNEQIDSARQKFDQVLELSPNNLKALDHLGRIYLRETFLDLKKAKEYFQKIIVIDPNLLVPRIQIAVINQDLGDYENEAAELNEIIHRDLKAGEMSVQAKFLLLQMGGGSPEKAKQLFAYLVEGEKLFREEKLKEAREQLEKALLLVPEQVQALYLMSLLELKEKNIIEAERDLTALLKVNPNHLQGRYQYGLLLGIKGKYNESMQELEKVIALGKEGRVVQDSKKYIEEMKKKAEGEEHFNAGMEEMKKLEELEKVSPTKAGEPLSQERKTILQKAVGEFEAAVIQNRDNPYYFYNLGFAYVWSINYLSAEAAFKKSIAIKPDLMIAHYRLAILYNASGAVESALKEFEQVINYGKPEDEEVKEALLKIDELKGKVAFREEAKGYALVGAILVQRQDYKKAGKLIQKATELVPWLGEYWYDLGNYYEAVKDDDKAAEAYQKAIEKSPNFSSPYFYLGIIQERRGEFQKAIDNFKKAAKYLTSTTSKEATLVKGRLDYYEARWVSSTSVTLFGYDSNTGATDTNEIADVYSTYGLNVKNMFYKSLKLILSAGISSSSSIYYYSQTAINSDNLAFEARWPEIYGMSIVLTSSFGVIYAEGGFQGWNSQLSADFQSKSKWFDSITTHLGYTYSLSAINSFYDYTQESINWSFTKNYPKLGGITASLGLGNSNVVASDDSQLSIYGGLNYSQRFLDYYSGSFGISLGESEFKNPDSTAIAAGLGNLYRKNESRGVNTSVTRVFFKNITLNATVGWQSVNSNLPTSFNANLSDILTQQTLPIGRYQKYTMGVSITYSF